jgi:hypothetical protein
MNNKRKRKKKTKKQRCSPSFLSFLDSKVAAGENGSEQRTAGTKWRQRCQAFSCV